MLGTEIADYRIRDVAFEDFRRPALPFVKEILECFETGGPAMPEKEFGGRRRRAGARVEKDDVHFAPRECLINYGQVAQHQSQKAEAEPAFDDGKNPLDGCVR